MAHTVFRSLVEQTAGIDGHVPAADTTESSLVHCRTAAGYASRGSGLDCALFAACKLMADFEVAEFYAGWLGALNSGVVPRTPAMEAVEALVMAMQHSCH